jgi:aryl-phospho-beta-D-glucosidase BglC (GH1 family)
MNTVRRARSAGNACSRRCRRPFEAAEWARLDGFVAKSALAGGMTVVLDPHNYARWHTNVVGGGVSNAAFADFWSRLATAYKGGRIASIFALMNEPHDMPTEQWLATRPTRPFAAIRSAGAKNLVLVPGNGWTVPTAGATAGTAAPTPRSCWASWTPAKRYAYEVHQYLDGDSSGGSPSCVSQTIGVERLTGFTAWLRSHAKRGLPWSSSPAATTHLPSGDRQDAGLPEQQPRRLVRLDLVGGRPVVGQLHVLDRAARRWQRRAADELADAYLP